MKSFAKGLRVLGSFTPQHPEWGVSELARAINMDRVVVWRLLRTLCAESFMVQDPVSRRYRLGPRVIELTGSLLTHLNPFTEAKPLMAALWQETQETVRFVLRSGLTAVVASVLECPQPVRIAGDIGRRVPLYCTAAGRLFLAFGNDDLRQEVLMKRPLAPHTSHTIVDANVILERLDVIKREGVSIDEQEMTEHASAIATPIFRALGEEPVACIAVMGPSARLTRVRLEALKPRMREIALSVSQALGCPPLPF